MRKNRNQFILNFALILAMIGSAFGITPVQAATYTVTTANDTGAGSLREAIALAPSGSSINFDPALAGQTITLASDLIIDTNLTIDGSGPSSQITISGGNVAHLEIDGTISPVVTISDLIISNGYTSSGGGAIYSSDGTVN